jgi:GGDEF domain-containing protein/putative methionine-R-sulfoxide reductase with GAF domain
MPPYLHVPDPDAGFRRLADMLRLVLSERLVEDVLARIAETLDELVPSQDIIAWEKHGEELLPVLARGANAGMMRTVRVRVGEGLTGLAALMSRPICSNDAHLDPRSQLVPGTEDVPEAIICVPLVVHEALIGVLSLYRRGQKRAFSRGEFELACTFADLAAIAIDNAHTHSKLEQRATTDELTGVANRRGFREVLAREVAAADRHGHPLSLLLFDLDGFKAVNDTHGHERGDLVARTGGDEFVFLLPHATYSEADGISRRLQQVMNERAAELGVTACVGISSFAPNTSPDDLLSEADQRLYKAKRLRIKDDRVPRSRGRLSGRLPRALRS